MKQFNIRVYGLLLNENNEVLLSDETRNGFSFTKFPGGGLEWGEGIHDCLKREFKEELGISIRVGELFYLTDFFQESAFNQNDQLISVYYIVSTEQELNREFLSEHGEQWRWHVITDLSEKDVTFPIDKLVATMLAQKTNF